METQIYNTENGSYLETDSLIDSEADALDIVGACGEHEVSRVLLHAENLSERFYDLKSGLAGAVLLKLGMYRIKTAVILSDQQIGRGKFYEMVLETNRGNQFRVFAERAAAVAWLLA